MMPITVLQVDRGRDLEPYPVEREIIEAAGGRLVIENCQSEDEVIARAGDAEILWVNWDPLVTRRVMEALPTCQFVVRWGVGYDQIPVGDATELGVAVGNAPAYGTDDVAEHAIALLVGAARRVPWLHAGVVGGGWPHSNERPIHRMKGRTLGIVGVGRIGSAAARRGIGLGLRVLGNDPYRPASELREMGVEPVGLDELLAESDYVSLHVPLNDETRGLLSRERLAKLRPEAILVNTSRGPVIDEVALIEVLRERRITAAALDVFASEPLPVESPLRGLHNVILTPHAAGYSIEAMADLRADMANTAAEWIRTGWSARVVNPQVRERLRPRRAGATGGQEDGR